MGVYKFILVSNNITHHYVYWFDLIITKSYINRTLSFFILEEKWKFRIEIVDVFFIK